MNEEKKEEQVVSEQKASNPINKVKDDIKEEVSLSDNKVIEENNDEIENINFEEYKNENIEFTDITIRKAIFTNVEITNSNLEIISSSLYRMMKINPKYVNHFNYMGVCCCAPGCSMIFNKRSRDVSINYDNDLSIIPMHDWWVAINTARDGYVSYIIEPTMLYRQHSKNVLGATCVDLNYFVNKIKNIKQVFISYKRELKWLNLVNYGKWYKYIFYKIMYTIIRQF